MAGSDYRGRVVRVRPEEIIVLEGFDQSFRIDRDPYNGCPVFACLVPEDHSSALAALKEQEKRDE